MSERTETIRRLAREIGELGQAVAANEWERAADILNRRDRVRRDTVPRDVVQNALMQIPAGQATLWFALRAMARDPQHPAHQLADAVVHVVQESLLQSLNLDNPAVSGMMDKLQQAGLLTAEQRAAIHALGDHPASLAELEGLGSVSPQDVLNAVLEVV